MKLSAMPERQIIETIIASQDDLLHYQDCMQRATSFTRRNYYHGKLILAEYMNQEANKELQSRKKTIAA